MKRRTATPLLVLFLIFSTPTFGQETGRPETHRLSYRLSELAGSVVYTELSGTRGVLDDVLLNEEGAITHLVLRIDEAAPSDTSIEELAGRTYLVPVDRVRFTGSSFYLVVLGLPTPELPDLPRVDEGELPAGLAGAGEEPPFFGTRLTDFSVIGGRGRDLGRVRDVMLDFVRRRIGQVGVEPAEALGLGQVLASVPPGDVQRIDPERSQILLAAGAEELERYPRFAPGEWPGPADEVDSPPTTDR